MTTLWQTISIFYLIISILGNMNKKNPDNEIFFTLLISAITALLAISWKK